MDSSPTNLEASKAEPVNADLPAPRQHYDRSIRARIAGWIKLRIDEPSLSNKEIAQRMGIAPRTLSGMIYRARKEGWLTFEDPMSKIEYEIVPKVVDNLNYWLDKQDKAVTIETAKGTIFRQFAESKGISEAPQTVLALKIEQPPAGNIKLVTGQIVGKPRKLEE